MSFDALRAMWRDLDNTGRIVLIASVTLIVVAAIVAGFDLTGWLAGLSGMVMVMRPGQRLLVPGVSVHGGRAASGGDWWDYTGVVAAYDAKNASSQANSYVNLANPGTYDLTLGAAPSWANGTGWTFNGSSHYLKTGITPSDGWSMLVSFASVTNAGVAAGAFGATPGRFFIYPDRSGVITYGYGGAFYDRSPGLTSGVIGIAGAQGYRNGSADGSAFSAWVGTSVEIYIGAQNTNGTTENRLAGEITALWLGSTTLSSGDVSSLSTAMAAL